MKPWKSLKKALSRAGRSVKAGLANLFTVTGSGGVRQEGQWLTELGQNGRLLTPVHCIASDVTQVEWALTHKVDGKFQRIADENGLENFEDGSPEQVLWRVWNCPHPKIPRDYFFYLTQSWIETVGRGAWRMMKFDEAGRPTELWPLPPHWIHALPESNDGHFEITWWGERNRIDVPQDEIIYFSRPDYKDPVCKSRGMAQGVDDEVNQDTAMAKYNTFYFENFAMLGVMLGIPGYDNAKEEMDAEFKSNRVGAKNAFRAFLFDSSNGQPAAVNLSPKMSDLGFKEGRDQVRNYIRENWQVPPERAGVLDNSSRGTIEGADFFQQRFNVVPRARIWSQELELKFTPRFDNRNERLVAWHSFMEIEPPSRLKLCFINPVMEADDQKLKVTTIGMRMGFMTVNEARNRHDLPDVKGGDVFYIPVNNVRVVPSNGSFMIEGEKQNEPASAE